jgi:putative lipoprotein
LTSLAAQARAEDEWWGPDKALHFGAAGVLAGGGYAMGSLVVDGRWERVAIGASVGLGAGIAKEVYDELDYGGASYKDFVFDLAGVAVGVVAAVLIDSALDDDDPKPITATGGGLLLQF